MPNIADLREKRNRILTDANTLMQGEVTAEIRTQFDNAIAEVDTIDGDIARLERSKPAEAEQRTSRPTPGATENTDAEVRSAFRSFITKGVVPAEQRDLLTINTAGAAIIPQAFYPELVTARRSYGGIVNLVKNFASDSGAPMKISLANDTGNMLAAVTEGTASSENDPTITSANSTVEDLRTGVVKVSLSELNDSAFDIDGFVRSNFGKQYYRGLSSLITAGDAGSFASVISGVSATAVTTAVSATLSYVDLVSAYAALDPAYLETATWTMNAATRGILLKAVDTLNRPIFIPSPTSGGFDTLLGLPVVINPFMANVAAGNVAVQLASYNDTYMLRTVNPSLSIIRLDQRYMDTLEVGFIGYSRGGGLSLYAGIAPVINITIHA